MDDQLQNQTQDPSANSATPPANQSAGGDDSFAPNPAYKASQDDSFSANPDYKPSQQPQKTGLQNFVEGVEGKNETNPDWQSPELGGMIGGAVKSAANLGGGLIDLLTHQGPMSPSTINPKLLAQVYKQGNPGATPQQVAAYVNGIVNNTHTAPPKAVSDAATWLHSAGQPMGFWENLGSIGEQALELFGTDGFLKMTTAPMKTAEAGKVATQSVDAAAHIAQAGTAAKFLKANPKIAGLITIGLKAAQDALTSGTQSYLHNGGDAGEATKTGLLGGLVAAPLHAVGELAGSLANETEKLAPRSVELNIPDQNPPYSLGQEPGKVVQDTVPIAATHPEAPEPDTQLGKVIKGAATKKGAFDFTQEHVQPAAVKAAQDNFADVAKNAVDDLHSAQGVEHPPQHPVLNTVDETAKYMKSEAQKTYQKLDEAAQPDVDAWEAEYGDKATKGNPNAQLLGPNGEPTVGDVQINHVTANGENIPPKPMLFTELQDQINGAKDTIKSDSGATQVERQNAIQNLPQYQQEMKDFLAKHGNVVQPGELDAANATYAKGLRFDWVADKIRQATRGAGEGTVFKGDIASLSPKSLESLPRQYDTRFGEGSFHDLLGSKGYRNFNDVVNTLKSPQTGSLFNEWLKSAPFGFGKFLASTPAGALADKILFDPAVGERLINGFKKFQAGAEGASKVVRAAVPTVVNSSHIRTKPNPFPDLSGELGGTQ